MSKNNFAPLLVSPEYADNGALSHYILCDQETGEKIGIFCDENANMHHTEKREKQYAALIAAAPEMYELLQSLRRWCEQNESAGGLQQFRVMRENIEIIEKLLKKARGEK